jgi:diguanylate cyclase (GGDEF)-like protein
MRMNPLATHAAIPSQASQARTLPLEHVTDRYDHYDKEAFRSVMSSRPVFNHPAHAILLGSSPQGLEPMMSVIRSFTPEIMPSATEVPEEPSLAVLQDMPTPLTLGEATDQTLVAQELAFIRQCHSMMGRVASDVTAQSFVAHLRATLTVLLGTPKFVVLTWHEETSSYQTFLAPVSPLLDGEEEGGLSQFSLPQTLDVISDHCLQEMLQTTRPILLEPFEHEGLSMAFLALEAPETGDNHAAREAYTRQLQWVGRYLGGYLIQYMYLKEAEAAVWFSECLKSLSYQLVSAYEEEHALQATMSFLMTQLHATQVAYLEFTQPVDALSVPVLPVSGALLQEGAEPQWSERTSVAFMRAMVHHHDAMPQFYQLPQRNLEALQALFLQSASPLMNVPNLMTYFQQQATTLTLAHQKAEVQSEVLTKMARHTQPHGQTTQGQGATPKGFKVFSPQPALLKADRIRLMGIQSLVQYLLRHDVQAQQPLMTSQPSGHQVPMGWLLPVLSPTRESVLGAFLMFYPSGVGFESLGIRPERFEALVVETCALTSRTLKRLQQLSHMLALAHADELTGLLNRRGLKERLEAEVARCRRSPRPLCVALIDVDFFKQLNDTHGHLTGDWALQHLARFLRQSIRKSDMACRYGGEEFLLVLPDTPLEAAHELLNRLRQSIQSVPIPTEAGETVFITFSAGVAPLREGHLAPELTLEDCMNHLLGEADHYLYHSKKHGRNQVSSLLTPVEEEGTPAEPLYGKE